jgi:drug/metabolite transporter (DMT)-like permease
MIVGEPPTSLGGRLYDRPYLLLTLTSLFWAINLVLGRYVVGTIPPVMLAQTRWAGAAVVVVVIALPYLRRDWQALRDNLGVMLLMSFTGITVYNTLAYYGLQFTEAINGLLMQSAAPLLIALWSLILFRDRLSPGQLIGILVSLSGVVVIVTRGDLSTLAALVLNQGDLWLLAALASYAFYAALLRLRPKVHFLSFLAFTTAAGAIMLVPATLVELATGARMTVSPQAFAVLAYVIVFPSILAYICFNRGVELIGANRAGPFFHLIPVFGSAIAILFLGERPQLFHALGYALIVSGIFVAQYWRRRQG